MEKSDFSSHVEAILPGSQGEFPCLKQSCQTFAEGIFGGVKRSFYWVPNPNPVNIEGGLVQEFNPGTILTLSENHTPT